MKIHLNRAGQSLGQFTPEEVRAGFKEGKFGGTDLAWRDGMPMWKPLAEVIDEIAPDVASTEAGTVSPPVVPKDAFPWDKRAERGFFSAFLETIRMVLLEPTKAFQAMSCHGGYKAPLIFYVCCVLMAVTIHSVYNVVFEVAVRVLGPGGNSFSKLVAESGIPSSVFALTIAVALALVLFLLFAALIAVVGGTLTAFVGAALTHISLIVVGGAKKPYETTFRVLCYTGGASLVFEFIPCCGWLVGTLWYLVVGVIGLSTVNGIGKGRALAAFLLPLLVCCCLPTLGAGYALWLYLDANSLTDLLHKISAFVAQAAQQ